MSNYRQLIAADGPLAYWRLNEAPGSGTIADSVNSYSGTVDAGVTLGGAAILPNDPTSTSAVFPGTFGHLIRVANVGSALSDVNGQGLEWWCVLAGLDSNQNYDAVHITTAADEYGYWSGDGKCYPAQFMAARINAFALVPTSGRHHLVVTRKTGGQFVWYLDGSQLAAVATPFGLAPSTALYVGGVDTGSQMGFNGRIAHVSLWNKELTSGQVAAHYAAGLADPSQPDGTPVKGPTGASLGGPTGASVIKPNSASLPGANNAGGL